jgi:NADH-quinone oxidoreductase subunit G
MPTVIVNGIEVAIGEKERLNGIQAAERAGIEIPYYCWHPGLSVVASCRMCLTEVGKKDEKTGKIAMQPRLAPACQTPATDGTIFVTNSEKVKQSRAMVEEDLLLRHPVDCPICDKAGECDLQDFHFEYGQKERRADIKPFTSRRRDLGATVTLFVDRCVMCSRCVRFTREISGTSELMVINRGAHEEIDVFRSEAGQMQFPLANKLSGNVVDLCPVGALGDKDFLYKQRVWFMRSHDHVCANCSTGCSIKIEENQDHIYRLKPRENPHVNQWWMCDEGRYGWKHVHDAKRVTQLRRREKTGYAPIDWSHLGGELDQKLRKSGRIAAVISPNLTVEEAYLLCTYVRAIDAAAVLAVGPIPVEGTDEKFPNGFTVRAEKCPNRKGVEAVVSRLSGGLMNWGDFLRQLEGDKVESESFGAVWLTGGYRMPWHDADVAAKFAGVKTLIVQDCFQSPLWDRADYQIPGATFAEREGSFVNAKDRLQSFRWAIRPPTGVLTEGQLYWQLLKKPGLYRAAEVLQDIARDIACFSAAAEGVPEHGVDLKVNQLAESPNTPATVA